jgi:nicotinamide-nucleotide amidase
MDARDLVTCLRNRNWRLASAESCTGGLIAATLTDVAGASDVFGYGFVTYANQAKIDLLGVSPKTLHDFGAVSEQVAAEMAQGACAKARADMAVSVTGIAGPGGSEFKPEGRVCFGLTYAGHTHTETVEFGALGRGNLRWAAMQHALGLCLAQVG